MLAYLLFYLVQFKYIHIINSFKLSAIFILEILVAKYISSSRLFHFIQFQTQNSKCKGNPFKRLKKYNGNTWDIVTVQFILQLINNYHKSFKSLDK